MKLLLLKDEELRDAEHGCRANNTVASASVLVAKCSATDETYTTDKAFPLLWQI
jgi:hypothetical protein